MKISKSLKKEMYNTINNYNRKITRLEQSKATGVHIPERIGIKDLTADVNSVREVRKLMQRAKDFSSQGGEKFVNVNADLRLSQAEIRTMERELKQAKKRIYNERYKTGLQEVKVAGKKQKTLTKHSPTDFYRNLEASRKALNKNLKDLDKRGYERLKKQVERVNYYSKKEVTFKYNYLKMFQKTADFYGLPKDRTEEIVFELNKLKPGEFVKLINQDRALEAIMTYYPDEDLPLDPKEVGKDINDIYDVIFNNIDEILKNIE